LHDAYALKLKIVKLFDDVGVKMLAGTDTGGGWVIPGFSLHQEFDEFARAGVPPLHVLQMTTLNAAEFLGKTATMGSIETGKNADLVVLDANPVESVGNLHEIRAVVRAGVLYDRKDLDAIEEVVAKNHPANL
jgi:imidazolonepropionase-like amidohydrolase